MANFEEWKRSATGRFLKSKGLTDEELRREYRRVKQFFKESKVLR